MNAELLWNLFLRTGLPEAYLLFLEEKRRDEAACTCMQQPAPENDFA